MIEIAILGMFFFQRTRDFEPKITIYQFHGKPFANFRCGLDFRPAKNRNVSIGPLVRWLASSLAPLTHSLTPELVEKRITRWPDIKLF